VLGRDLFYALGTKTRRQIAPKHVEAPAGKTATGAVIA
jgi:hypothetical protein